MASNTPPFALTRCKVEDMEAVVAVAYQCFPEDIRRIYMRCRSTADLAKIREKYVKSMRENPADIWIAVKDTNTGKYIAASNWRVHLNGNDGQKDAEEPPEWLKGEELEMSRAVKSRASKARAESLPGPYVHLHMCFTGSNYRRRGAAAMMLQWGCDFADQLFLPGWLHASAQGNFLYKQFGFYDFEVVDQASGGGVNMKRDARTDPVMGGKPEV
ncbi:hypothetical protein LTR85_005460 [Meristemomyces frigidus]|nr:hypothetical protein LTR85_005460 [Meristemomyces frigidus]